jgi:hypothetical protein
MHKLTRQRSSRTRIPMRADCPFPSRNKALLGEENCQGRSCSNSSAKEPVVSHVLCYCTLVFCTGYNLLALNRKKDGIRDMRLAFNHQKALFNVKASLSPSTSAPSSLFPTTLPSPTMNR